MNYRELHTVVANTLKAAAATLGVPPDRIEHGTRTMPTAAPAVQYYIELHSDETHDEQAWAIPKAVVTVFCLAAATDDLADTRIRAVEMAAHARDTLAYALERHNPSITQPTWDNDYPGYSASYVEMTIHLQSVL